MEKSVRKRVKNHCETTSVNFSLRSILRSPEVKKGQIFQNRTSLRKTSIISGTIIARTNPKKASDSELNSSSTMCPQIWSTVISLGSTGHQSQNYRFLRKLVFVNNFLSIYVRKLVLTPSCFSHHAGSKHIHDDLERSIWKFDLRSRSRDDPRWPKWVILHIFRSVSTRGTQWDQSQLCSSIQSKVISKKRLVSSGDLGWPQMTFRGVTDRKLHLGHQQ